VPVTVPSAPQFRGGGKASVRSFAATPSTCRKKVRALALRHALSAKAKANDLIVLDSATAKDAKTKDALAGAFEKLG
jgi:large subunit ribosomal protein L4